MATTTRKKPTNAKRAAPTAPKFEKATFDGGWSLLVPECMGSLEKFREWSSSPEFPEQGNIAYLQGEIYIDMSLQQLSSHVSVLRRLE